MNTEAKSPEVDGAIHTLHGRVGEEVIVVIRNGDDVSGDSVVAVMHGILSYTGREEGDLLFGVDHPDGSEMVASAFHIHPERITETEIGRSLVAVTEGDVRIEVGTRVR